MKGRKYSILLAMCLAATVLAGCGGSGSNATTGTTEEAVESAGTETTAQDIAAMQTTELPEDESLDPVDTEAPAEEAADHAITWYMDEEGFKNDALGILIRKDALSQFPDSTFADVSLAYNFVVYGEDYDWWTQQVTCQYWDGDLDSYMAESNTNYAQDWVKETAGDWEYAMRTQCAGRPEENYVIAFVDHGIAVSTTVHREDMGTDETLAEYLIDRKILQPCDDYESDALAYEQGGTLYCPALQFMMCGENGLEDVSKRGIILRAWDLSITRSLTIYENDMERYFDRSLETAQEAIDNYYYNYYGMEIADGEGILSRTVTIGNRTYLGGGTSDDGEESWIFCPEDLRWIIILSGPAADIDTLIGIMEPQDTL